MTKTIVSWSAPFTLTQSFWSQEIKSTSNPSKHFAGFALSPHENFSTFSSNNPSDAGLPHRVPTLRCLSNPDHPRSCKYDLGHSGSRPCRAEPQSCCNARGFGMVTLGGRLRSASVSTDLNPATTIYVIHVVDSRLRGNDGGGGRGMTRSRAGMMRKRAGITGNGMGCMGMRGNGERCLDP